jgi:hypothetical protein
MNDSQKPEDIWTKMKGEPDVAFAAFVQYRDRPAPRRIDGVYGSSTVQQRLDWCNTWLWDYRCGEYDRFIDKARTTARANAIGENEKENEKKRGLARMELLDRCVLLARRHLDLLEAAAHDSDMPSAKIAELTKLIDTVIKYSRLEEGKTTSNDGGGADYADWSIEGLRELNEVHRKEAARKNIK